MASVNKVILIGNVCADPEVRYTASGEAVANFRLAMNESWTDKSGAKQEKAEFIGVVVWGKQAEPCGKYLAKGRPAYVEGKLQTREWSDKEGNKRFTTEVRADRVQFLGDGKGKGDAAPAPQRSSGSSGSSGDDFGPPPPGFDEPARPGPNGAGGPGEDDIPF